MSSGRLAAVGLGVMALVCTLVIVAALLGFTWLVDRASEIFEHKAAHPGSSQASSPAQAPGSWAARGFVTDVGEYSELPGAARPAGLLRQ
jgi:hypothetical protein